MIGKRPNPAHNAAMATTAEPQPFHEPTIPFAEQRSDLRAGIGRRVGENLDNTPGLWRLTSSPSRPVQLYVRGNFLSPEECAALCLQIDSNTYPSPLYDKEKYQDVRTSYSCDLDNHDPLVSEINARIAALLGMDPVQGEPLQGQRYQVSQEFKHHSDFFYIDQPYWAEYEPHGGQRTWTAMIYLNEPDAGGATRFKLLDFQVEPKVGRILIWNNMALDGSPNPWTLHEGMPVEAGTKYIVTKWYRERQFV